MSASAPVRTAAPPRTPRLSRRAASTAAAVLALLLAVLLSLAVGARSIPPGEVFDVLLHGGHSDAAEVIR
ncbi:iron ABC transporter permease, partial [Streptomyces sp. SID7499]|nr:iron ABC transporter permease [Streptomyces sp. SID7499]